VPECRWFSFFPESNNCVLTADCLLFDDTCTTCLAGEKDCEVPRFKLMAVGGYTANSHNKVEVLDITEGGTSCPAIANIPSASYGSVGIFINNQSMVCGGWNGEDYVADCVTYDAAENTWQSAGAMREARYAAAAVLLSDTQWWVTGGHDNSQNFLSSTELFTVGQGFSAYTNLPVALGYHNLVKVDDTHVMLLGGNVDSSKVWLFDLDAEAWSELPDLPVATHQAQAGLVGGKEVVVVAGASTDATQVFDLDSNTWRRVNSFNGSLYGGASVPFRDNFLVVGGRIQSLAQRSVFTYDTVEESWLQLPQQLETVRDAFAAFLTPFDLIRCD